VSQGEKVVPFRSRLAVGVLIDEGFQHRRNLPLLRAASFDWRGVGEFAGRRTEEKLGPWPGFFLRRIDQEGASKCAAGCDRRGVARKQVFARDGRKSRSRVELRGA
jgi:hypothetical protein